MAATAEKIGRNDPCWCGSGRKYKRCHLQKESQAPPRIWEVDARLRAEREKGTCLHATGPRGVVCGQPAIGSHTVMRKMLKQIARDGHVYHHSGTIQDIDKTQGKPALKLIGVNRASALPVFCSPHDGVSFAPLEQLPFTGSAEQCFLLAYRAVCLEYLKKRNQGNEIDFLRDNVDRGKSVLDQVELQRHLAAYELAVRASVRDMEKHKDEYDAILLARDFSPVRAFQVSLTSVPEILCAGALYPECDFDGKSIGNLANLDCTPELITFSLISTDTGGAFVFAWLESSDGPCRQLASSLDRLQDHEVIQAIVRFVFEFCENRYLNPDWWDNLDSRTRTAMLDRFATSASPFEPRAHKTCLRSDGLSPVAWHVSGRNWS
jgi:hypothetical protein